MDGQRPERRKMSSESPDPRGHPPERNWLEEREQQRRPEEQQISGRRKQRGQAESGQEQRAHGAGQRRQEQAGKKEPDRVRGREGERTTQAQAQTVKILYTNAKSISSKLKELTAVTLDTKPYIILLTKTWCNKKISDAALTLDGFKLETEQRKDRTDTGNGAGRGLLVYSRNELKILPSNKHKDSAFNQFCEFSIMTEGLRI
jgi:hypothetical protein